MVVEFEAQAQQQPALEHPARDAGVTHRPEQDRVVPAELLEDAVGQGLAGRVPAARAEVVVGGVELLARVGRIQHRAQDAQPLRDDFPTDPVPWHHR